MAWSPEQSACHWCMICQSLHSHNDLAAYLLFEREIGWLGHGVCILFPCNFQGILHHAPVLLLWATSIRNWKAFLVLETWMLLQFDSFQNIMYEGMGMAGAGNEWFDTVSWVWPFWLIEHLSLIFNEATLVIFIDWIMLDLCGLKTIGIYNFYVYIFCG